MLSNFLTFSAHTTWPWNIGHAEYAQSFSVASKTTTPAGLFFKSDGLEMYVSGNGDVHQYTLSAAWDISSATFTRTLDVSVVTNYVEGLFFKSDGTEMYIASGHNGVINQYTLSTGWDISTATYIRAFDVSGREASPDGVSFKSDGAEMYMVGYHENTIIQYTLSTGWDISTATYTREFDVSAQGAYQHDLFFKSDGTEIFTVGSSEDQISQYTLSTAWDISSATYTRAFDVSDEESNPQAFFFKTNGESLYVLGTYQDTVQQYDM